MDLLNHKSLHLGLGTPDTVGETGSCGNPRGPVPVGENSKLGERSGHGDFGDIKHPNGGSGDDGGGRNASGGGGFIGFCGGG